MTKRELIDHMYNNAAPEGMTKKACEGFIDELFDTLFRTIKKDGKITVTGFGTFSLRKRKARKGVNPQTGEKLRIKASKTVGFKPSSTLKAKL